MCKRSNTVETFWIHKIGFSLELVIKVIRNNVSKTSLLFASTNNRIALGIKKAIDWIALERGRQSTDHVPCFQYRKTSRKHISRQIL